MGDLRHYVFRSTWTIDAEPSVLFEILCDVPNYPKWFPLVREVQDRGEGNFWYICQSVLPYQLVFDTKQTIIDEVTGVLEASMEGHLIGYTRWTVKPRGDKFSTVEFLEDVRTNKFILDVLAPIAKPLFKLNHVVSMRQGQRGLRAYAAGYAAAKN